MNRRLFDWIWHVRGTLPLAPGQTADEAFDRLDPLLRAAGTSHDRTGDVVTFRKKDQAAQDSMAIFDGGEIAVGHGGAGRLLRYDLASRALLFCFLAPLLFLAFAHLMTAVAEFSRSPAVDAAAKAKADAAERKLAAIPMNPIDKALGAPPPKKPDADKKKKKKDEDAGRDKKLSPTPAYVFAGIFAVLYVAGRILEDWLVRRLFRRHLAA